MLCSHGDSWKSLSRSGSVDGPVLSYLLLGGGLYTLYILIVRTTSVNYTLRSRTLRSSVRCRTFQSVVGIDFEM